MPKDTIQLKDGIVYINNKAIEEKGKRIASHDNFGPIIIKEDLFRFIAYQEKQFISYGIEIVTYLYLKRLNSVIKLQLMFFDQKFNI